MLPAGRLIVGSQIPPSHPQARVLRDYTMAYQKTYHRPVDTFGGHAWDAVTLLRQVLAVTGPDRAKIRAQIEKTKRFVGTGGVFNFSPADHNGLNEDAFVMVQVHKGQWTLLK